MRHTTAFVTALLAASPQLRELYTAVDCTLDEAVGLLECRPPFAPLRMHALTLRGGALHGLHPAFAPALADARLHPDLAHLSVDFERVQAPGEMDALADAVVARRGRLRTLSLVLAVLSPADVPALARMLRHGALADLEISNVHNEVLVGGAGMLALSDALRANDTLKTLALIQMSLPAALMTAVLGALQGHSRLQTLDLSGTRFDEDAAAVGAALGALLAADAPALTALHVPYSGLGEAGLGPLCDALPRNRHLHTLCIRGNRVFAGFCRRRLLPAVRANTSLRWLWIDSNVGAVREAQQLLAAR